MDGFILPFLPPSENLETIPVLKKVAQAHRYLAELKGVSGTIPDEGILINTLALQEAKDSSAIENIITSQDDLFKEELFSEIVTNAAAKEVKRYSVALQQGFQLVRETGLLTSGHVQRIQATLEQNRAGFRRLAGTSLKNEQTGETVYVPPQNFEDIDRLMGNLESFINDDSISQLDPLIKMAVIHYQFESIHPFYDGNGRTGRIINVLYLVLKGLLDIPVLYLSRYIIRNKSSYYRLLQSVRTEGKWEEWILYLLSGIEETSKTTIHMIEAIRKLMQDYKHRIREQFHFYSQDLLNNLFCNPYTKIEFIERDLKVSRITAAKYLDDLSKAGFLVKEKYGRSNYYINVPLFNILSGIE